MPSPVPCTTCHTTLVRHCPSPTCHWMRCPAKDCEWYLYDLERGARSTKRDGKVERLGAPDGEATTPDA